MATAKPISYNEMRDRAVHFATRWQGETRENAEAQTFWNEWFAVFGVDRRKFVTFEQKAQRAVNISGRGRIDAFWPGHVAVEHKSAGKSLLDAEQQALDYLEALPAVQMPRQVITSDFRHFRVLDLERGEAAEFDLQDLPAHIGQFGFLAGYETRTFRPEDAVNVVAAEKMGELYDALQGSNYTGHDLKVFLVRLMFLFFADDTGVWEKGLFEEFLESRTAEDGSDLGPQIERLFQVLNRPEGERSRLLDEALVRFPYVNGGLFEERIAIPDFDSTMRAQILDCSYFDWSAISPAIFGSMFQSVMNKDARRALGAYYTTEQNILKVVGPLFLDELRAALAGAINSARRLRELQERLATLTFFDPAAGSGNFLIIAYRELRQLEFDILVRLDELEGPGQQHLSIGDISGLSKVNVDQFYAIEVEEFPARIAETALYLVDHLENMRLSRHFGQYFARIPLTTQAHVHVGNALQLNWGDVLPSTQCSYLFGNPPFVGALRLDAQQTQDRRQTFEVIPEAKDLRTGRLDYVLCWYAKAMRYMRDTRVRAAFVSTSSITQGEQARSLSPLMQRLGYQIDFAHRTFSWTSEARGKPAVHVVIIGFSEGGLAKRKWLYDYPDPRKEPVVTEVGNINVWLLDAENITIAKRSRPLAPELPGFTVGSQPSDGGHLIVSADQLPDVEADPVAAKYVHPFVGTDEMLGNKVMRYCLWLRDASPHDLRASPILKQRIEAVRTTRALSPTPAFRRTPPHLFTHMKHPDVDYIAMPRTSSENRRIVPMEIFTRNEIASEALMFAPTTDRWLFALLQSGAFMAWCKIVCGRRESRLRISADLAYNAFPFPDLTDTAKQRLSATAEAVLAARANNPDSTLADLYDPSTMPADLVKAHDALDRVVDRLFGFRKIPTEAQRATRLFRRYRFLTEGTPDDLLDLG